jgi:hypothetical protein
VCNPEYRYSSSYLCLSQGRASEKRYDESCGSEGEAAELVEEDYDEANIDASGEDDEDVDMDEEAEDDDDDDEDFGVKTTKKKKNGGAGQKRSTKRASPANPKGERFYKPIRHCLLQTY